MALTPKELDAIGESFAKSLKKYGIAGDGENTFASSKTRRSRGASDSPAATIAEMDEMLVGSFQKTIKRWKDAHRDATRMLEGSALRDAHDAYVENLEDIAKKTKHVSKRVVDSYAKLIEANKGNHSIQQKAYDSMREYTNALEELKKRTENASQDQDARDEIRRIKKEAAKFAEELRALGIEVEEAQLVYNRSTKNYEIQNKKHIEETIQLNNRMISAGNDYVDNLTELHSKELRAKDEFVQGLIAITTKGLGEAIDKTITTTSSRLQNLQASTEYIEAALNGMSPQEMNAWYNANRNALALQGLTAEQQSDALQETMNKMGYFGAEMMATIGKLNAIQMNSGIEFSKATTDSILGTIERVQALEGVTREEAIQIVAEASQSNYHMMTAYGKTGIEQAELLRQQVFSTRQVARATGLTAKYMEDQEQQQVNARFASIIDKVKTSALMPAYITEMEHLLGRTITEEERVLMSKERLGGLTNPDDIKAYNDGIGAELRRAYAERATTATEEAINGPGAMVLSTSRIAGEVIGQNIGIDATGEALAGMAASNRQDTLGAAELAKNYDELINASQSSLSAIEQFYNTARATIVDGVGQSPVGGLLSGIGGIAQDYLMMKAIDFGIGAIAGRFGMGGAAGTAAAAAGGGAGIMSKMGGLLGTARGGIGNAWTSARGSAANMMGTVRGLGARGMTGLAGMGAGLKTFGTDALAAMRGLTPSQIGGGLAKAHGLGAAIAGSLIGAYQGFNTSTSDYAAEMGIASPTSVGGDLAVRSAGVMSDVGDSILQGLTFGMVDGKSIADTMSVGVTDAIGGTINDVLQLFGGGVDDSAYEQMKAMEAQQAMTSGAVLGEEGEQVKSLWDRMLDTLSGIEENTGDTVATIEQASARDAELEQQRRAQSAYAAKVRANHEELAREHAAAMTTSAESAVSAQIRNLDSAWGY